MFDEAVAWARDRAAELVGKRWDEDGDLVDNPDAEMAITDTIREEIREAVAASIEGGDAPAELADAIEGIAGFSEARAEMVARTEIIRAHGQGQMTALRKSGVVEKKAWSTAGEDVCDDCQENEDAGDIDLDDDFPSGDDAPPAHPACLPGNAHVLPAGAVTATSERWYDGDLVVLRTRGGKELSCTPNHPILSDRGFVAADLLNEGDHVVCAHEWISSRNDDHQYVPPTIEQVAKSLGRTLPVMSRKVPLTAEDFHGDARGGDIAIIRTHGGLACDLQASLFQLGHQRVFERTGVATTTLDTDGSSAEFIVTRDPASGGFVGRGDQVFALRGGHPGPSERLCLRLAAWPDARFEQNPSDDSAVDIESLRHGQLRLASYVPRHDSSSIDDGPRSDRNAAAAKFSVDDVAADDAIALQIRNVLASDVALDEIVQKRRVNFAGHVYNLQTTSGFFVAEGIVTHNCRCVVVASFEESGDEDEDNSDDEQSDDADDEEDEDE